MDTTRFFNELETLVNTDSGSSYVEGVIRVADILETLYKEAGLHVSRVELDQEKRPFLVATSKSPEELKDKEKPYDILFIGHMDTVFPEGTAEKRPFIIEDGKVKGPGAADMKAGNLMALYLIKELNEEYPEKCFAIANNPDEELGSPYSWERIIEEGKKARYGFDMEPGRITGNFVKERKGCQDYRVYIHGIASHAGNAPDKGASAIKELARWIDLCDELNNSSPGLNVNPGLVSGGTATNVIADYAELGIDVRILDYSQMEMVEKAFDELAKNPRVPGVTSEWKKLSDMPPMKLTPETQHMVDIIMEEGEKLNYTFEFESAGGSSDASFVSGAGTPIVDACGPHGEGLHGDGEYFLYDTVEKRFQLLKKVIKRLLEE